MSAVLVISATLGGEWMVEARGCPQDGPGHWPPLQPHERICYPQALGLKSSSYHHLGGVVALSAAGVTVRRACGHPATTGRGTSDVLSCVSLF